MSTGGHIRSISFLTDSSASVDGAATEQSCPGTFDPDKPEQEVELGARASQVIVLGGVCYEVGLSDPE